jgi:hypothetical protein
MDSSFLDSSAIQMISEVKRIYITKHSLPTKPMMVSLDFSSISGERPLWQTLANLDSPLAYPTPFLAVPQRHVLWQPW